MMLRRLVFFLFLIIGTLVSFAQEAPIVISNKRPPSQADTADINERIRTALKVSTTHPEIAIQSFLVTLKQSQYLHHNWGIFRSYLFIGWIYHTQAKNEDAIYFFDHAMPYAEMPENIYRADQLYRYTGAAYATLGKPEQALKYYYKALEVLKGRYIIQGLPDSSDVYSVMGRAWGQLGELSYAIQTMHTGIAIAERRKNTHMQAELYYGLAAYSYENGEIDTAEKYYKKSFQLSDAKNVRCYSLMGLSKVCEERGDYLKALDYINQCLLMMDTVFYDRAIVDVTAQKANVYLKMKAYAKAEMVLAPILAKADIMNSKDQLDFLLLIATKTYASNNKYQEAYYYLNKHTEFKNENYKQVKGRFVQVWLDFQTAEKNKKILTQRLHISEQKSQLERTNFWMGLSILGVLLLFSISFVIVRHYKHKQLLHLSLIEQMQQQEEIKYLKAQVRGEELERERIARDLHDSVASQLLAMRLQVENIQHSNQTAHTQDEKLSSVFHQLNDVTQNVRKTAHDLLPDLLLRDGLAMALASFCSATSKTQHKDIMFQEYGDVPPIDKEIELTIYRIIQELITHVVKIIHNSTPISVSLNCADNQLSITIKSNNIDTLTTIQSLEQLKEKILILKGQLQLQLNGRNLNAHLEFPLQQFLS